MKRIVLNLSTLLFGTVIFAWVNVAEAQQAGKVYRIGHLTSHSRSDVVPTHQALYKSLRELGYIDGKNIIIETRYTEGKRGRYPDLVAELIRLKVDVIVSGSPRALRLAKKATSTIPIVMAWSSDDPVTMGLVSSLARPGGNITGMTSFHADLNGKRLELIKETVPQISRVAVMYTPGGSAPQQLKEVQVAARALNIQIQPVKVQRPADFDNAFSEVTKGQAKFLFIIRTSFMRRYASRINSFAERSQLPTMWNARLYVARGGLMSYGADPVATYQRAATFIDKILKGRKPADLPVERPTKFEFSVNLKTAKKIGLTIPPSLLYRADKVFK